MDTVIPPPCKIPEGQKPETAATSGGSQPEESREPGRAGSKTALERRRVRGDPNAPQDDHEVEVEDLGPDSEDEEQGQRNPLDPGDLTGQITVRRPRPMHTPQLQDQSGLEDSEAPQTSGEEEFTKWPTYGGFTWRHQVLSGRGHWITNCLPNIGKKVHSTSTSDGGGLWSSIHAAESQASKRQQELLKLQKDHEADIQSAVGEVVYEYREQLVATKQRQQFKDCKHQQMVHQLQDQFRTLELLLASHATLPSVRTTKEEADLWEEIFNYLPGTVNIQRGAAIYESQDQPFSFQKQVQFGDRLRMPDLKLDADSDDQQNSSPTTLHSSTPHCGAKLMNQTFNISQIPNLTCGPQDAAAITAEVSAAAAAQASKEFCQMRDPKITKFKGGYLADAELTFRSWHTDIMTHIQDQELDNKAVIQLIKDMTQENARCEVEFQLDLCGGIITYQDLLKHLSIAFQGGDKEANLIAEFYSHGQKTKGVRRGVRRWVANSCTKGQEPKT